MLATRAAVHFQLLLTMTSVPGRPRHRTLGEVVSGTTIVKRICAMSSALRVIWMSSPQKKPAKQSQYKICSTPELQYSRYSPGPLAPVSPSRLQQPPGTSYRSPANICQPSALKSMTHHPRTNLTNSNPSFARFLLEQAPVVAIEACFVPSGSSGKSAWQ